MTRRGLRSLLLAALPLLAGCATGGAAPAACPAGAGAATIAEAYFGRSVHGRPGGVTEAEWVAFLEEVVTPAFPDGLTALDGYGQWRNPRGEILREASKVLLVVLPGQDIATARARLLPVEQAWKARFRQQSVLTVYRPGCASF